MNLVDLLLDCSLFDKLDASDIKHIIDHCNVETFEKGQYIIKEGMRGKDLFVLLDGQAVVAKKVSEDKKAVLATLRSGDFFGELVLIEKDLRTADVIAKTDADVVRINYDEFFDLYRKQPAIFALILLNISKLLTKRLEKANKRLEDLARSQQ